MDLGNLLIESKKSKHKGSWKQMTTSIVLHSAALAAFVFVSMSSTQSAEADQAIPVFMAQAAPPPPPPPPPPPAAQNSAPKVQPKVQPRVEPVQQSFVQPKEIPDIVPVVDPTPVQAPVDANPGGGMPTGGVPGGVEGGVAGGVVGGVVGGVIGGQLGGQIGGVVGGELGGTGTKPAPPPPPAPPPSGPLRVGGDVKAPRVTSRPDPVYTEVARRARVQGIVIVEAIIDKHGNVDNVKVIRGLPMGLSESAVNAVKRCKFRPGTMNGRPVDVIFNLTVNFRLGADGPSVSRGTSRPAPQPEPERAAPEPPPTTPEPSLPEVPPPSEPEETEPAESLPTPPSV